MTSYRVEVDGATAWTGESAEYDKATIPAEYRARPKSGTVKLFVDDVLIGVQIPLAESERLTIEAANAADLGEGT